MGLKNPEFDAYIAHSSAFARPILKHLRAAVHDACPEVVEELKWGHPSFMYHGILCGFAAFKAHCIFGFWKQSLLKSTVEKLSPTQQAAVARFGKLTTILELPSPKTLKILIQNAAELNEQGVKVSKPKPAKKEPLPVPDALRLALDKNKKAKAGFEKLSPSHRREYSEWISQAKRDDTRARRVATTIEWLTTGKYLHWKYERK